MKRLLRSSGMLALDFLFPPTCGVCGAAGGFLCAACRRRLPAACPPRCRRCWAPAQGEVCSSCAASPLDGARAAFVYEGGARDLVQALKYRSLHVLAGPMGELLATAFLADPLPVDVVVPVPLHVWRRRRRGFNQSELLARAVAGAASLELDARSLRRVRRTPQQMQADDHLRRERNVQDAFRCSGGLTGRHVLLVDDVMTTGATLRECARTARAAGAASVWALSFCRAD